MTEPLFQIRDLRVFLPGTAGPVLNGVDLRMDRGQTMALVGPSGCGKSLTVRALCGLLPPDARWSGTIVWRGQELRDPRGPDWQAMRGPGATMVLQEPAAGLNPVLRVGDQIAETVRLHRGIGSAAAREKAVQLLAEVRIPDPEDRARLYPHQLSGGMRQRVLLAAALACDPLLLIADEPTTALDPTVQRGILVLLEKVRRERGMGLLFISHDRDVVSLLTDQVAVMERGRVVAGETVDPSQEHEPGSDGAAKEPDRHPLILEVRGLRAGYEGPALNRSGLVVRGVDVDLVAGQAVGLAGESGCGKTTLARALCLQIGSKTDSLRLDGKEIGKPQGGELREYRRRVQMIFQDPGSSLDPRQTVGGALEEALAGRGGRGRVPGLLQEVGLEKDLLHRFPHQLSGGQRQRVAVARCLAVDPAILIADEVTSALDQRSRRQLLGLFLGLMENRGLALLLISHDLDILQEVCSRVMIMYGGLIVEVFTPGLHGGGVHPYTRALQEAMPARLKQHPKGLAAVPDTDPGPGQPGGPGCPWYPFCKHAKPHCVSQLPTLQEVAPGHLLRCPETEADGSSHFIDT